MSDISVGIELFNDADYFAAHDFFEDLWSEAIPSEKFFYQGLVHVSVGSFHLVSGNIRGALSQYSKCKMKLERYVPVFLNIDIENLIEGIDRIVSELHIDGDTRIPDSLIDKLPKIKYSK